MPGWWEPFRDPVVTIVAILVLPALVATLLGLAVFKRRVRGAYFAILSQALAAAFAILLVGQQKVTGGTNGLNGFRSFFGFTLSDPVNKRMLYFIAAGVLLAMVARGPADHGARRYGELLVAVRDQENRVRFLGYDPAIVKTVAYAIAACFAGHRRGAVHAHRRDHLARPTSASCPSIGFLVGVAIGGRATLLGPVLGAIGVSWAETSLSESFPSFWIYFQGALFILVVAFLPNGLATIGRLFRRRRRHRTPCPATRDARRRPRARRDPLMSDDVPTTAAPLIGEGSLDPDALEQVIAADEARFKHDYLEIRDLRVVFDGFVAVAGRRPHRDAGRPAVPHRAQRRRQDHDRRRHHRAGARHRVHPVRRRRAASGKPSHKVARAGVGPHVPDRQRVRRADRAAEPRHRGGRPVARPGCCCAGGPAVPEAVEAALETVGLTHARDLPAGVLAHGQKQWLEIGMLLVQDARLLLLDEPVAGMSQAERRRPGSCSSGSARSARWSSSSTTWSSCAASPRR